MADNALKQEAEHRGDGAATPKTTKADTPQLFFEEKDGRFYALLPSGKRPEIRPVLPPDKLRDIIAAHPKPKVPLVDVQPEGVDIAQRFPNPQDPGYLQELKVYREGYMAAMMARCLFDGLIVPEDNEWAWLLKMSDVPVPEEDCRERTRLYAQEMHPEFWDREKPNEAASFVAAVQQITLPSEAGINIARKRFRNNVEKSVVDESRPASGGLPGRGGDGGVAGG